MKRFTLCLLTIIGSVALFAQTYDVNFDAQVLKNYDVFKKGDKVHVISMTHDLIFDTSDSPDKSLSVKHGNKPVDIYKIQTDKGEVSVKEKLEKVLEVDYKTVQNFWDAQIIFNVLESLSKKGTQESLRAEMEQDVLEYINRACRANLAFNDPYLESYIYSVITKIAPSVLIDGRPGIVNLLILSDPTANAGMYPNGTLVITTGLISLLHSEDELAAVLAHEIAHFVLDHSVQNHNNMVKVQQRAEFWAGFATVLTGAAETYAAIKNPYYMPGAATAAVATASSQIAASVCERLGMNYTRQQETEADKAAMKILKLLNYDPNALATALSRIEESMRLERSIEMYFASDHPALVLRIRIAGTPNKSVDKNFEKIISFAVSDAARMKMQDRRFRQALPLFSQNIDNGVATADDYIQKANCLLYMKNDPESFKEVGQLINSAKRAAPNNINIYKTEIIAQLRQNKYSEARTMLSSYKDRLNTMMSDNNRPEDVWSMAYVYAYLETLWVDEMMQKLKSF